MVSPRYTAALVLSALLLASCSGSDNGPTAPEGPSDPARSARSLNDPSETDGDPSRLPGRLLERTRNVGAAVLK